MSEGSMVRVNVADRTRDETIETETLLPSDERLVSVLASAFCDYPLAQWLLGHDRCDETTLGTLFRVLLSLPSAAKLQVEATGNARAVAFWLQSERLPLFTLSDGWTALRIFRKELGAKVARRLLQFHLASERMHPAFDHDYLFLIAVSRAAQRHGLARHLLHSRARRADKLGRSLVLETSNPENLDYYQRFGFEVTSHYWVADRGPENWIMARYSSRVPS